MAYGLRALAATLIVPAMLADPAAAATITHLTESSTYGAPAPSCDDRNVNAGSSACSTSRDSPFVWGSSTTVQDASFAGSASADLDEGALRTTSSVENRQPSSGPVLPAGERSHVNYSQSVFGDTFSISVQDPNVAVSGAKAILKFDISGSFAAAGSIDLDATYDFFGRPQAYNSFEFSSTLNVREVGAFDIQQQARELDPADFPDFDAYYAEFLQLNAQYDDTLIARTGVWQHSNQSVVDATTAASGFEYSVAELGDVFTTLIVEIPLLGPETVFEWHVDLFTGVTLDSSTLNALLSADFGSTGILSIVLPQGYALSSLSSLFPSSNVVTQVPEPASLGLLAAGLAGLRLLRRRAVS